MKKMIITALCLSASLSFAADGTMDIRGNVTSYSFDLSATNNSYFTCTGPGTALEQRITRDITNLIAGTYNTVVTNGSIVTTNVIPYISTNIHTSVDSESVTVKASDLMGFDAISRDEALSLLQARKPLILKQDENKYFYLVHEVLVLVGDPRKDITPAPKLSTDELDALLSPIFASSPMAQYLTSKLLALDSKLKRTSILWWDDCSWHSDI